MDTASKEMLGCAFLVVGLPCILVTIAYIITVIFAPGYIHHFFPFK